MTNPEEYIRRPLPAAALAPDLRAPRVPGRPRYLLSFVLLVTTIVTTTALGAAFYLGTRTDVTTDLPLFLLTWDGLIRVWTEPELRSVGLAFSLPALFILFCHELGHVLACRYHRIPATLPYFLPVPFGLGTFGAFMRMGGPIQTRSQLFDVGVAGPIAGFVALLPFLFIGIARSTIAPIVELAPEVAANPASLIVPGRSLLINLVAMLYHGSIPPGATLDLHPFALAAWFGLLATALNLLPLGQLDGGHILYASIGSRQRYIVGPLWLLFAIAAVTVAPVWLVLCGLVLVLGLRHPPVVREETGLRAGRRVLAVVSAAIFLLCLAPRVFDIVTVDGGGPSPPAGATIAGASLSAPHGADPAG